MALDVAFILILALFAILGLFSSLVVQLFRLIALGAIWTYVRFFCDDVASSLALRTGLDEISAYLVSLAAGVVIIYFALNAVGELAASPARPPAGGGRRALVSLVSLVRGGAMAMLFLCLLAVVPAEVLDRSPRLARQVRQSYVMKAARVVNPLQSLGLAANLAAYRELLKDEQAQIELQDSMPFRQLTNRNSFREAADDPEVRQLLQQQKFYQLLGHPRIKAFLADGEARRLLAELDPRGALDRAHQSRPQIPNP